MGHSGEVLLVIVDITCLMDTVVGRDTDEKIMSMYSVHSRWIFLHLQPCRCKNVCLIACYSGLISFQSLHPLAIHSASWAIV